MRLDMPKLQTDMYTIPGVSSRIGTTQIAQVVEEAALSFLYDSEYPLLGQPVIVRHFTDH